MRVQDINVGEWFGPPDVQGAGIGLAGQAKLARRVGSCRAACMRLEYRRGTGMALDAAVTPDGASAPPPFNNARWGDYSFAVPDPGNGGVWLATEYIPPPAFQAEVDNWGTDVFEIIGH